MMRLMALFISLFILLLPSANATTCFGLYRYEQLIIVSCQNGICQSGFSVDCKRYQNECLPDKITSELTPENQQLVQHDMQPLINGGSGIYAARFLTDDSSMNKINHYMQLSPTPDLAKLSELKENYVKAAGQLDIIIKNNEKRDSFAYFIDESKPLSIVSDLSRHLIPLMQRILCLALIICFFITSLIKIAERKHVTSEVNYKINKLNIIFELAKIIIVAFLYSVVAYTIHYHPKITDAHPSTLLIIFSLSVALPQLILLIFNYKALRKDGASAAYSFFKSLNSLLLYGYIVTSALCLGTQSATNSPFIFSTIAITVACIPLLVTLYAQDAINKSAVENKKASIYQTAIYYVAGALFLFILCILYSAFESGGGACPKLEDPEYPQTLQSDFNDYLNKAPQMGILVNTQNNSNPD